MKPLEESLGSSPTITGARSSPAEVLGEGTVLGNYRIVRFLGAGGMGAVYVAEHIHLKTRHALKTIRPEFARRPGFEERFLREARLTAHLKHPHIVPCTDAGVAGGTPYLVMDYIEGPTGEPLNLRQLLDQRRERGEQLDEDEAAAVGLEICKALDYAHSFRDAEIPNGIIHRDLKPGNILLDTATKLYITDFGLARLVGEKFEESVVQAQALSRSVGDEPTLRAGQPSTSSDAVGTFDYMSPEQREGRVADARSDIYAMGAILYELLTGRKVVGALAPPSRLRPGLNPAWDDIIIVRCLAYEPGERYATAGELARAIEGVTFQTLETCPPQAGQPAAPVSSRVCETGSLAANPRKANKQAIIIGAIVAGVAGLLVMGGLMWWRMGSVQRPVLPEEKLARGMPTKQLAPVMKSTLASKTSATLSPGPGAPIPTGKIFQDPDIDRVEPIPQPRPASTAAVVQAKSVQPGDGTHQAGDIMVVDLGGGVKLEFVWIPPGRFLMGSPANEECNYRNEGPQHQVIIASGFWMGKTEVTQRQYEQLVGENPSSFKGADLPVDHVDRNQSKAFCEKLQARLPAEMRGKTARLPTEAEWEYACRAGSKGAYAGALDKMGWYDQNSGNTTHPVGQKQANAWGLYDMHGNVWEWCWDGMRDYATSAVTDPKGADSSCVIRGGSWCNYAHFCRSAYRGDVGSHLRKSDLGFRVVVR